MRYKLIFNYILILNTLTAVTINIPADYSTIQEGIDAAIDGDIIMISQGTYYENLIINKEITLTSSIAVEELEEDWYNNITIKETIINGSVLSDPRKRSCLIIRDGNIQPTIQGLTFEAGVGTAMLVGAGCSSGLPERSGGGILIYDAYPTINFNRFIGNGISSDNERGRKGSRHGGAIAHYEDAEVEFDEDRNSAPVANNSNVERTVPGTMDIQNNYFENNSSGNGQDFYSQGYVAMMWASSGGWERASADAHLHDKARLCMPTWRYRSHGRFPRRNACFRVASSHI